MVHFDVDVIDFIDAPLSQNTGRNVGVTLAAAGAALAELLRDPRVLVVTVTELNPFHGAADGSTLDAFWRSSRRPSAAGRRCPRRARRSGRGPSAGRTRSRSRSPT